jgi:hypothetical protein
MYDMHDTISQTVFEIIILFYLSQAALYVRKYLGWG